MAKRSREDSTSTASSPEPEESPPRDRQTSESTEPDVHTPKYASLQHPEPGQTTMKCTLPPHHPATFTTYAEYETHYQQNHTNRCSECGKNFPTAHFFDLHIAENHDPITAAKRDSGQKTYACFVEDCDKVCGDWKKRRSHLVDKHGFPRNYDFLVVDHGIDHRRSLLRAGVDAHGHRKSSRDRGRSGSEVTEGIQASEPVNGSMVSGTEHVDLQSSKSADRAHGKDEDNDDDKSTVDELTSSFSSLKMVPRSVTFGQRKGRAGFAKN